MTSGRAGLDVSRTVLSDSTHVICSTCGRDNPARLTFCEDCGARLSPRATAATPPVGIPRVDSTSPASRPSRPSAPDFLFGPDAITKSPPSSAGRRPSAPNLRTPEQPLDAVRIADLRIPEASAPKPETAAPPAKSVMCSRCRGMSDATVGFCRFCGAPVSAAAGSGEAAALATDPSTARVLSIGQDGNTSATFELKALLDIGRLEGDVVISWDPYLSPRHLRLELRSGVVVARDLGTVNGTFVRVRAVRAPERPDKSAAHAQQPAGKSAKPESPAGGGETVGVTLQDQDLILLGQQVIRFELVRDAEAGFGPATQHGTALFGTPAGPVYARLCQRTVEGVTRDVFHVRKDEIVLGRELGDMVFTDDAFLSRRHAVVRRDAESGAFTLFDAGSSNGTFLRIRGETVLQGGDELRIGQQLFRIETPPASPRGAS